MYYDHVLMHVQLYLLTSYTLYGAIKILTHMPRCFTRVYIDTYLGALQSAALLRAPRCIIQFINECLINLSC